VKYLNQIVCGEGSKLMGELPNECIDLTVTSPPYDDLRDYQGYVFDFKSIANELYRITKTGGVVVWVVGDTVIDYSESCTSSKQKLYFKEIGFNIHDTMIYEKNGVTSPDNTRYYQCFEYMFVLSKGRPKTINLIEDRKNRYTTKWGGGRKFREKDGSLSLRRNSYWGNDYGRRFNIWRYNTGAGYSTKDKIAFKHPAIFPEALAEDHIKSWSNIGDIVFDPMCGSGTVPKMAILLERNFIAFDISQQYMDLSRERIRPYQEQGRLPYGAN